MTEDSSAPLRSIRSFVIRAGRMTEGQHQALEHLWPAYGLEMDAGMLDRQRVFGRSAPVVLEIGFGMGGSLIAMAQARPDLDFIGIEVHPPGIGTLLKAIDEQGVRNLKVYRADAKEVLQRCIADASLHSIQIYFPDPWHKKRHHKRRLIQADFVEALRQKLEIGGTLHLATDWQEYAEQMMEVLGAAMGFSNRFGQGAWATEHQRPETKFERRGQRLGHGVWDLIFERIV